MIPLLIVYTLITDNTRDINYMLTKKDRIVIGVSLLLCVLAIWGSMYLAFNEVGATFIGGVQGRYYIPLLIPFYIILLRKNNDNRMNFFLVYYSVLAILGLTIWNDILMKCII